MSEVSAIEPERRAVLDHLAGPTANARAEQVTVLRESQATETAR